MPPHSHQTITLQQGITISPWIPKQSCLTKPVKNLSIRKLQLFKLGRVPPYLGSRFGSKGLAKCRMSVSEHRGNGTQCLFQRLVGDFHIGSLRVRLILDFHLASQEKQPAARETTTIWHKQPAARETTTNWHKILTGRLVILTGGHPERNIQGSRTPLRAPVGMSTSNMEGSLQSRLYRQGPVTTVRRFACLHDHNGHAVLCALQVYRKPRARLLGIHSHAQWSITFRK